MIALQKLRDAQKRTGSLLSVGLEPAPDYMPAGLTADITGYKAFLRTIINASREKCCAYKLNLAFFEALGRDGWELLHEIRASIPDDVLIIADAKRGDIGSTAQRYASAMYDQLEVDAVTLNPLMGEDSARPFLEYRDKLNIFLCLTSNPGSADFLKPEKLYLRIAENVAQWSGDAHNCALVVGATHTNEITGIRNAAPELPFLIPGVGAQGGSIASTAEAARLPGEFSGLIFHVTRGILPGADATGDLRPIIEEKVDDWNRRIADALKA